MSQRDAETALEVIRAFTRGQGYPGSAKIGTDERNFAQSAKTSCFVDTNLLVYTVDPREPEKRGPAADLRESVTANAHLNSKPTKPQ